MIKIMDYETMLDHAKKYFMTEKGLDEQDAIRHAIEWVKDQVEGLASERALRDFIEEQRGKNRHMES